MATGLIVVLMLGMPQAAPAATDAAAMVARYKQLTSVTPSRTTPCDTAHGADITVCGKRGRDDQRLPLPDEREAASDGRSAGEANAACLAHTGQACPVCPPGGCTGVNLLAVPFKLFRIVRAIVDPDR